jgi:hypothetical protein
LTLKEVAQRIQVSQQQAERDPAGALKKNRDLFLDLIRQDQAFIIPEAVVSQEALEQKLFRPYIAPAQEGDPRLFLRVFSHLDPATVFAEQQGQNQVCEIDGVELVQLAKTYFLRGTYGFLLNDGSAWTAIAFPDLLTEFYKEILGDESLGRPEFISLIQFINMVRQNYAYNIQAGRPAVYDVENRTQARFTDKPNDIWSSEGDWVYEDCKLEHLMMASGASNDTFIHIKTAKCDMRIQPAYLRAALCAAGMGDRRTQPDLNFHTESIALDYRMQDFDLERFPLQCELAELPRLDDEPEPEPPATEEPPKKKEKPKAQMPGFIALLLAKFKNLGKEEPPKEPAEDVLDVPPEETLTEEKPPEPELEKKRYNLDPKLMVKLFFGAAFLIILVAVIMQVMKPTPIDDLKEAVEAGNTAAAVELYDECISRDPECREELLQLFAADLQASLDGYAADTVTANQLAEKINNYKTISVLQEKCDAAYLQASDLEQSKTNYNKGLVETSMVARLTAWRGVIIEDIGSMTAMKNALETNADLYKGLMFEEIKGMDRGPALSALMLLQSYYPNDKDVVDNIQDWRDQMAAQQIPDSVDGPPAGTGSQEDWPITMGEISVQYNGTGYDLYIPWQNTSGRPMNGPLFAVTALDADGVPVVSTIVKEDGTSFSYSQYVADAGPGPYEDGFVWPETAYWENVWVTDQRIESVRLDSISINYTDGSDEDPVDWSYTATGEEPETEPEDGTEPWISWEDFLGSGLS